MTISELPSARRSDIAEPGPHLRELTIDELIAKHRGPLLAYLIRLTDGDRALAEDLLQETFLRAWRRLDKLSSLGSLHGWLIRVAHNLAIDNHRASRSRPTEVDLDVSSSQSGAASEPDRTDHVLNRIIVARALDTLSPEHKAALEETILRDHTSAQAAQTLGVPVGTVKSRVFYGLQHLRLTINSQQLRATGFPDSLAS